MVAWLGCVLALTAGGRGQAQAPASVDMPALIRLARQTVVAEVRGRTAPRPDSTTPAQPVFVTIERNGRILGCRGSLSTRTNSLECEVVAAARSAARHDPRYPPVRSSDLKSFLVTVTVVQRKESIESVDGLQPEDGLILTSHGCTGVVLPWEGKDPKVRLNWAYRKAGVKEGASALLFRLIAERCRG